MPMSDVGNNPPAAPESIANPETSRIANPEISMVEDGIFNVQYPDEFSWAIAIDRWTPSLCRVPRLPASSVKRRPRIEGAEMQTPRPWRDHRGPSGDEESGEHVLFVVCLLVWFDI